MMRSIKIIMKFKKSLMNEGINFITKGKDYKIHMEENETYAYSNNKRYYVIDNLGRKYGLTESEIDKLILEYANDLDNRKKQI
jgi:dipeptidase